MTSPGLIFVKKAFLPGLFSATSFQRKSPGNEVVFSGDVVIERNFAFQNGFGLSIKTTKNRKITASNS